MARATSRPVKSANGGVPHRLVERAEDFALGFEVLRDGFDDEARPGEFAQLGRRLDAGDDRALLVLLQTPLVHVALEAALNRADAATQELLADVAHDDLVARARGHLRDAVAHRPRADNSDDLGHKKSPKKIL